MLLIVLPIIFWDGTPPWVFELITLSVVIGTVFAVAFMILRLFSGTAPGRHR